jgi:hypothetical protein
MIQTTIIGRLESPTITLTGIDLTIRTLGKMKDHVKTIIILGKVVTITMVIDVMNSEAGEPIEETVTTKANRMIGNRINKTPQRMTELTSEETKARIGTTRTAEMAAVGSSMVVLVTNAREIVKIGIMNTLRATIIEMRTKIEMKIIEMRTKGIREEGVEAPTTSTITGKRSVISKKWTRIEQESTMVQKTCREI